jgi:phosphatidylglycerophosphate synthase
MAEEAVRPLTGEAERAATMALAGAAALVGASCWLVFAGHGRWAGPTALGAGVLLLAGGSVARRAGSHLLTFLDSAADRAFDGCLLSTIALAVRDVDPPAAAAAVAALVASFLGAYVRARGRSLGYVVEDSAVTRGIRYALVGIGLAGDWLGPTMIALLVVTTLAAAVRASQVAKQERV